MCSDGRSPSCHRHPVASSPLIWEKNTWCHQRDADWIQMCFSRSFHVFNEGTGRVDFFIISFPSRFSFPAYKSIPVPARAKKKKEKKKKKRPPHVSDSQSSPPGPLFFVQSSMWKRPVCLWRMETSKHLWEENAILTLAGRLWKRPKRTENLYRDENISLKLTCVDFSVEESKNTFFKVKLIQTFVPDIWASFNWFNSKCPDGLLV